MHSLQHSLDISHKRTLCWKIKVNGDKLTNVVLELHLYPHWPVVFNEAVLPCQQSTKFLGLHQDEGLMFCTHIEHKRTQLDLQMRYLFWLKLYCRSSLSLTNNCLLYVATPCSVYLYKLSIWRCAANALQNKQSTVQHHMKFPFLWWQWQCCHIIFSKFHISYFKKSVQFHTPLSCETVQN